MAEVGELPEELRALVWGLTGRLRAASASVADLSTSQQAVLARLLTTPDRTSAELARAEYVTPQAMSLTIAPLLAQGLVEAQVDAADARRRCLRLTPTGRQVIEELRNTKTDWLRESLNTHLNAREQQTVSEALALLRRLLD